MFGVAVMCVMGDMKLVGSLGIRLGLRLGIMIQRVIQFGWSRSREFGTGKERRVTKLKLIEVGCKNDRFLYTVVKPSRMAFFVPLGV